MGKSIFYANNITVHTFFSFFLSVPAQTSYKMGILMHVSNGDLSSNACEFNNMSNGQKHPAEPFPLLLIVSTLSPCHFLVVINLNRLDQEKKKLCK